MRSNGFTQYLHSGGIGKSKDNRSLIPSIAKKVAEAKVVKGVVCLNNGKPNGGTWKTPSLDIALNSKAGFKGGETG